MGACLLLLPLLPRMDLKRPASAQLGSFEHRAAALASQSRGQNPSVQQHRCRLFHMQILKTGLDLWCLLVSPVASYSVYRSVIELSKTFIAGAAKQRWRRRLSSCMPAPGSVARSTTLSVCLSMHKT